MVAGLRRAAILVLAAAGGALGALAAARLAPPALAAAGPARPAPAAPGGPAAPAPSARGEGAIVVLVSQDAPPYEEALAGFRRALEQEGVRTPITTHRLRGDEAVARPILEGARSGGVRLILTLGSLATRAAIREVKAVPIVAGLILSPADLGRAPNATGVVLEFDVETEFRWLRRLLPEQKNVGVLFSTEGNQARIDQASRVARALGLTLHARRVGSPRDLPEALESLTKRAEVLWGVADEVVLTPQTVQPILLFSIRNRIPFVGLSTTWVKAGALYALDRDYEDVGRQCAEMAIRILNGAPPGALRPATPRKVVYLVNRRTADLMRLDLRQDLLSGARAVIE
jgi:putative ABC transport system substrate-binding protein